MRGDLIERVPVRGGGKGGRGEGGREGRGN